MNSVGWLTDTWQYLRVILEVGILAFLLYSALLFVRGTRAMTILLGLAMVIIAMVGLSEFLQLEVIEWILLKMWTFLAIAVLVLFQPEIRRAFAQIGSQQNLLRLHSNAWREKELIDTLLDTTFFLGDHRIGALIAIERDIGTRAFSDTGVDINAPVSQELVTTIFFPNTPLHDGGIIVRDNMLASAGCIFPLTQSPEFSQSLGTRHRAAVGITEETDAVAIVVSEESGAVSLAHRGRLVRGIDRARLQRHLIKYLVTERLAAARQTMRTGLKGLRVGLAPKDPTRDDSANP